MGEEVRARRAAEPRSRVTFGTEQLGERGGRTVTHEGFGPGSTVPESVRTGWPRLLSGLKTLLETGEVLPAPES